MAIGFDGIALWVLGTLQSIPVTTPGGRSRLSGFG
jgi:hypothetical protein